MREHLLLSLLCLLSLTQNNGKDTTKSPLGMFGAYEIDNDLKMVDDTIREYWGLNQTQEADNGDS